MGSFDYVCAVSGLPIGNRTPVKAILLASPQYLHHDEWQVQSLPVDGVYNEYGTIEDYDEAHVLTRIMPWGICSELLEVGVGDNTSHDVPVSRDSTFQEFLAALWEKRVNIGRRTESKAVYEPAPPVAGIPCIRSVTAALSGLAHKFHVDQTLCNEIRVRAAGYFYGPGGEQQARDVYARATACLGDFAVMYSTGSGEFTFADHGELVVRPLPFTKAKGGDNVYRRDPEHDRKIRVVYVRADVYDALLSIAKADYVKHYYAEYIPELKQAIRLAIQPFFMMVDDYDKCVLEMTLSAYLRKPHLACVRNAMFAKFQCTAEDAEVLAATMLEMDSVCDVLKNMGHSWFPYRSGPQDGSWDLHAIWAHKRSEIINRKLTEMSEDAEEFVVTSLLEATTHTMESALAEIAKLRFQRADLGIRLQESRMTADTFKNEAASLRHRVQVLESKDEEE